MNQENIKVAIGVATERQKGWRHFPQAELDVTRTEEWLSHFQPGTIANLLAEHVWEHLTWTQAKLALANCFKFLKPGGRIRLAVPDTLHASQYVVDAVSATGSQAADHNHLVDYDYRLITRLLSESGFQVKLLDWWDEQGHFHSSYENDENGYIMRSYINWPKHPSIYREPAVYQKIIQSVPKDILEDFVARGITHTSLIVDGFKVL